MPGTLKLKSEAGGSVILAANTTAASDLTVSIPPFAGTMATLVANNSSGGVNFSTPNVVSNGPAFFVYLPTASQTVTNSVATKVALSAKLFDTANAFDATTNYRFQPQVAGYYQFNGVIGLYGNAAPERGFIMLYKNGSEYIRMNDLAVGTGGAGSLQYVNQLSGSAMVYLNGSTDYIELWGWELIASGTAQFQYCYNGNYWTHFSGYMVRSA